MLDCVQYLLELGKMKVRCSEAMINSSVLPRIHNQRLVTMQFADIMGLVNQ